MRSLIRPASLVILAAFAAALVSPLSAALFRHASLQIVKPDGTPGPELPLEDVAAKVEVTGSIAKVELTHVFGNPSADPVEAIYSFPLPHEAAVTAMRMEIGDRVIRAVIQEKEAARKTYEAAKAAGKAATLLEQDQPNVFSQHVANIRPKERVKVVLTYVHAIGRKEGSYELAIPTTIGPRYLGEKVDGGDAARAALEAPAQAAGPGAPALSIEVALDTGLAIANLESRTHPLVRRSADLETGRVTVALDGKHAPDRDFMLRWTTSGDAPRIAVRAYKDDAEGTFMLHVEPPWPPAPKWTAPREVIFVVDCSGSQEGQPLEASKSAILRALEGLREGDTVQVVRFELKTSSFAPAPVPVTPENLERVRTYVRGLATGGGTDLIPALNASLGTPADPKRLRIVPFFTDGQIGNNRDVMAAVQKQIGSARLFTFGVGASTNRFIVDHMARLGRGTAEYVVPGQDAAPVIERFQSQIDRQVVVDLTLAVEGGDTADVRPHPIPDMIGSRPTVLLGRYTKPGPVTFVLRGRVAGEPWEQRVKAELPARATANAMLPSLWAQQEIDHLLNGDVLQEDPEAVRPQVTRLGLDHALVTPFTSFVAVEEKIVKEPGGTLKTVRIPLVTPQGAPRASHSGGAAPEPAEWALLLIAATLLFGLLRKQEGGLNVPGDRSQ